jgi:molybdopterin-guanine dinucleotide biosynthesis protein B
MKIIGLAGWSGAGKTTLISRLIPYWRERGVGVSTIKHAHHKFDIDKPGKDSWVHREAGAQEVLVCAEHRWVLMHELREAPLPPLPELLAKMAPVDLVVVEGFRAAPYCKIEVHREALGKPWLYPGDAHIVGLATDATAVAAGLPVAHLDDVPRIAAMMEAAAMRVEDLVDEGAAPCA